MAVAVAVALFGALAGAGLVWAADRALVAVGLMLPVTLLAVTFGRRGGIVGSLAALALYPLWASVPSAIALVLTGVLVGNAVDAIQDSEQLALIA